jgi:hypothetical protein
LEEELKVALNSLRRTTTSTTKPAPRVIIISNLKEEVEIEPQHVIEEQLQIIFTLGPVEEEELQQLVAKE